jgi:hypothetical protein
MNVSDMVLSTCFEKDFHIIQGLTVLRRGSGICLHLLLVYSVTYTAQTVG